MQARQQLCFDVKLHSRVLQKKLCTQATCIMDYVQDTQEYKAGAHSCLAQHAPQCRG